MNLDVKFDPNATKFKVAFSEQNGNFQSGFGEIHTVTEYVGGEPYEGSYDVTPKVTGQILSTKNKVMVQDTTVRAIPYFETSNNSGGNTVFIANEV